MAIRYGTIGYNVGTIDISTKLVSGESVTIGNKDDYDAIVAFAQTGTMKVKVTIDLGNDDANFDGTVVCNRCPNGVEFSTVTYFSDSPTGSTPIIIGGQILMDGDNLKCHISATTVS